MGQRAISSQRADQIVGGVAGRGGHFLLESGYHADLWFSLDALLVDPAAIAPQIEALAALLQPQRVSAVCGPLLGGAFLAQALASILGVRFYYCEASPLPRAPSLFSAQYRLPAGLRGAAANERFALVDDVISAGSSVRAAAAEIHSTGALVAVVGSLLLLGTKATEHFASVGLPVVAVERRPFSIWLPNECPLCKAGKPLEDPALC